MTQSNLGLITEAKDALGNTKTNISETATKRVILMHAPTSPRQSFTKIAEAKDGLVNMKTDFSDAATQRVILRHAPISPRQNFTTIAEAKDALRNTKTDSSDTAAKRVIVRQAPTSPNINLHGTVGGQNLGIRTEVEDALKNTKTEISVTAANRVTLTHAATWSNTHETVGGQNLGTITEAEDALGNMKTKISDTGANRGNLTYASASSNINIPEIVGWPNLGTITEVEDARGNAKTEISDTAANSGIQAHAATEIVGRQNLGIPEAEDARGNTNPKISDAAANSCVQTHASTSLNVDLRETVGGQSLGTIAEAEDSLADMKTEMSNTAAEHGKLRHAATCSNFDLRESTHSMPGASPKTPEARRKGWKRSTTVNAQIFENYIEEVRESNPAAEALLHRGEERSRKRSKSRSGVQVLTWEFYHWSRFKVFTLLEEPRSSCLAFYVSAVMVFLVLSSLIAFVVESIPRYCPDVAPEYKEFWFRLGFVFNACFTLEYLARFWSTSSGYSAFLLDCMNIIDIVSVLPFWVQLLPLGIKGGNTACLRVLRLLRVFRIFKLARFSVHLRIIVESFVWSSDPLILLGFFVGVGVFLFSTLLWCVERGEWQSELECFIREGETECSPYQSIPVSMYWAVTTMTTVGYGDACPVTATGKVITCMAMISGILVIAMPLSILSNAMQRCFDAVKDEFTLEEVEEAQLVANKGQIDDDVADAEALKKICEEIRHAKNQITQLMPNIRALVRKHVSESGSLRTETVTNLCNVVESNVASELDLMKQLLEGCILEIHQRHSSVHMVRQISSE